jgi:hypothetical protein
MQAASRSSLIQNHHNAYVRNIKQGEAQQRKYKRIKLGGGQVHGLGSD